jgi:serine/threonine-protein kinase
VGVPDDAGKGRPEKTPATRPDSWDEPTREDLWHRAEPRVGHTIRDKWHLDALLGVGGYGAVYAATHRNGMRAAVKILHAELAIDPGVRKRFLREGYVANKVKHPGAVAVLDDDETEDGHVFLVMELLEGETLERRRSRHAIDVGEMLWITAELLDVLDMAHGHGIIHRDVKPLNVFLTTQGRVKLLDFGIARLHEHGRKSAATRSGLLLGTPAYTSPEQARARWREVDARTDLWAVGATMFSMLAGRDVHEAPTVNEQLLLAMTKPAVSLATVARVPSAVTKIVDRALAFDKADRWPNARVMKVAVQAAYEEIFARPLGDAKPAVGVATDPASLALARTEHAGRERSPSLLRSWRAVAVGVGIVAAFAIGTAAVVRRVTHSVQRTTTQPPALRLPQAIPPPLAPTGSPPAPQHAERPPVLQDPQPVAEPPPTAKASTAEKVAKKAFKHRPQHKVAAPEQKEDLLDRRQ